MVGVGKMDSCPRLHGGRGRVPACARTTDEGETVSVEGGNGGRGLVLEEDGFDVFDVGVGGEAPDADVAAIEVAVGVPVGGDGGPFVVYFFPIS